MKEENEAQTLEETEPKNNIVPAASGISTTAGNDGGYGWVVVLCVFLTNAHTWGFNSAYGVFLAYYLSAHSFAGATHLEFAFVGGFAISMALLISPIATLSIARFGTRTTLLIRMILQVSAFVGASFTKDIWQLFLSQGVAFGWGMGFLSVASVGVIPQWFDRRRSLANGIATAGSGFGGLIYSLGANAMIYNIGLSWAFRVLAILALVVNGTCALFLKDRNKAIGAVHLAFDVKLLKNIDFLLLLAFGWFSYLGYIVLLFSLPNYARSIGLSAQQASIVGAIMSLGQACGRPFVGYLSDTVGRINVAFAATLLAGVFSFLIWIFAHSFAVLIFFAILAGVVAGTFWATIAPVTAEVIGIQLLPSALSVLWIILVLPTTFAEPIGLKLSGRNGSTYLHTQGFVGGVYMVAALCMWTIRWRMRNNKDRPELGRRI